MLRQQLRRNVVSSLSQYLEIGTTSDRIGGLSAAANAGCSISELQTHGRWKSDYAPKLYHKKSLFQKEKVSNVLNEL